MARTRADFRLSTCQPTPTLGVSSSNRNIMKRKAKRKKAPVGVAEGDRKDVTCPVCLEHPHNAVLLLCSSYDKGCRPFMCGTGGRHSNCFEQFVKAHTKATGNKWEGATELSCPLCRSGLKGWTVVEPVRHYLNRKKRSCMQDGCSFSGTFKEMCVHVRSEHPKAKPRAVDPALEQKWKQLVDEREQQDVISTITSLMPGMVVLGDYVVDERDYRSHGHGPGSFYRSLAYFQPEVRRMHIGHPAAHRPTAGMHIGHPAAHRMHIGHPAAHRPTAGMHIGHPAAHRPTAGMYIGHPMAHRPTGMRAALVSRRGPRMGGGGS